MRVVALRPYRTSFTHCLICSHVYTPTCHELEVELTLLCKKTPDGGDSPLESDSPDKVEVKVEVRSDYDVLSRLPYSRISAPPIPSLSLTLRQSQYNESSNPL
jgi:hypothetical protein